MEKKRVDDLPYCKDEDQRASRAWVFTVFDYNSKLENGKTKLELLKQLYETQKQNIKYLTFSGEKCPSTKKEHLQAYILLTIKIRNKQLQLLLGLGGIWARTRKGTHQDCVNYCNKPNKQFPDDSFDYEANIRYNFGEVNQGKRNDLNTVIDEIKKGVSKKDIIDKYPNIYIKYHNALIN